MFYGDCITESRIAPSERYFRSRDFKRALLEKKSSGRDKQNGGSQTQNTRGKKKKGFQLRLNGKCGE